MVKDFLGKLVQLLGTFIGAYFLGRNKERIENLERELGEQQVDSRAWANRPVSDSDFDERLRIEAERKRKDRS